MTTHTQKHTPGPWQFIPNRIIAHVGGQAVEVCAVKQWDLLDELEGQTIEANAKLISAAPDLLDALCTAQAQVTALLEVAREAIKKAQGTP